MSGLGQLFGGAGGFGAAEVAFWLKTLIVGTVSGVLSGMFGIGGGMITTPAIRLLLGGSAIVAVATPLPIIIPTALTGAIGYARRGIADIRMGVVVGCSGAVAAVAGAWATRWIGGSALMLATGVLVLYLAADMLLASRRAGDSGGPSEVAAPRAAHPVPFDGAQASACVSCDSQASSCGTTGDSLSSLGVTGQRLWDTKGVRPPVDNPDGKLILLGLAAGLYSGLLGLGGGFVIVPLLTRVFGLGTKRAIGTSLVAIAILSVPGTITHALLGHIDWRLAVALSLGVIPGAWVGARVTAAASERHVRIAFAILLAVVGAIMLANEAWVLFR